MNDIHATKIGVLGAGQLGKMLLQDASKMGIKLHMLDSSSDMPAAAINPDFTAGDIQDYDQVLHFGQDKDIITIEIEAVNDAALSALEASGKAVYPQPTLLRTIKDKGLQKQYYADHKLPTSRFELFADDEAIRSAVSDGQWSIPFVQKARTGGYDGKGVHVVRSETDLDHLLPVPSLLEELVDIDRELAVIVARSTTGEIKTYDVVEMKFHPTANLVECLFAPSHISKSLQDEARKLATDLVDQMEIVGLLAVELFLTRSGELLINEVAPRPHNSGHHTIEAAHTSQFEQHLRAILGLPLGSTDLLAPACMVNLLGHPEHIGPAHYAHITDCLSVAGGHLHLYGKAQTKPHRKMGHATVVADSVSSAIEKAKYIKDTLQIISK